MRIARIDIESTGQQTLADGTPGLPAAFASISRKRGSDTIDVELLTPGNERTHHVQADCDEDIWSMAECLQYQLDGHKGTNSMIHDYLRVLQRFAD